MCLSQVGAWVSATRTNSGGTFLVRGDHGPGWRVRSSKLRGVVSGRVLARSGRLYRERLTRVHLSPFLDHCRWGYRGLGEMENKSPWSHRKLLRNTL